MCSVICSSNISWITRSTISLRKEGSSSKIPCASCVSTLRWSVVIVLLPFDRLTLGTNHLGGRWPFFLPAHQITEVYGHNPSSRSVDLFGATLQTPDRQTKEMVRAQERTTT